MRIRRIGLFSAGKMVGAVSAMLALFSSFLWLAGGTVLAGASLQQTLDDQTSALSGALPFAVGGIALLGIGVVMAGVIGFLQGFFGALFYNVIAGFVGGIVLEVD